MIRRLTVGILALLLAGCSAVATAPPTTQPPATSAPAVAAPAAPQTPTAPTAAVAPEVYFTQHGDHPEEHLIAAIDGAQKTADVAIYSLTHPGIVQALLRAEKRGVLLRIITDHIQAAGQSQTVALRTLRDAGVPIRANTHAGLMHLKVGVFDGQVVAVGSYNWTGAASTTNDEVLLIMRDPAVARQFSDQFARMWADTKGFADWH